MTPRLLLFASFLFAVPNFTLSLAEHRAVPDFPNPLVDPFYAQPSELSSLSLGQVIATRRTNSTFVTSSDNLDYSYQIKFRSQDSLSRPIAAITTVLVPRKKSRTATGQASMLSFQNFEDAVSLSCSPSWAYVAGSGSRAAGAANIEAPIVNGWALDRGHYVAIPDHQGPTSSFVAGVNAGHIILDSIRAALTHENLSLTKTQIGMYGYSGGANAGVFASSLAEAYAPELNIVGNSIGGTPVSPVDTFYMLNRGPSSGLAGAGSLGLASAYPDVGAFVDSAFSPSGRATAARLRSDGTCVLQVNTRFGFIDFFDLVTPPRDFLGEPVVRNAMARETLLQAQASCEVPVPKHPMYMYHALFDEVVPFNSSLKYVHQQCERGADIRWVVFPAGLHIGVEILGLPAAVEFLDRAFKGTLQDVVCGTAVPEIKLGSRRSLALLGHRRVAALKRAHDKGTWSSEIGMQ